MTGCVDCFCMAIPTNMNPTPCSSSRLFRDKLKTVIEEDDHEFTLVDSTLHSVTDRSDLILRRTSNNEFEVVFDQFQRFGDDILYWKLPVEFFGNKVKN